MDLREIAEPRIGERRKQRALEINLREQRVFADRRLVGAELGNIDQPRERCRALRVGERHHHELPLAGELPRGGKLRIARTVTDHDELCLLEFKRHNRIIRAARGDLHDLLRSLLERATQVEQRATRVVVRIRAEEHHGHAPRLRREQPERVIKINIIAGERKLLHARR